ncbi:MAG: PspC domain-containing protein [Flavobacteriales bacterium]|nr:PspC domain-containing protein [Flavobacteriales bacterium]MBQ8650757.1 PspC domain-containing protein [Flavobacteriales bacterium]
MTQVLRRYASRYGLGVSSRLAARMSVRTNSMRSFMIYSAFFTLGASFVLYLAMAGLLKVKDLVFKPRRSVFDL